MFATITHLFWEQYSHNKSVCLTLVIFLANFNSNHLEYLTIDLVSSSIESSCSDELEQRKDAITFKPIQ